MDSDQWQVLRAAFATASELDGAERETYLATFRRDHPQLSGPLLDLLTGGEGDTRLRDAVASAAADVGESTADDFWLNRSVGPWRIVERIAGGGMGAVFLAERADSEYTQRAAIKVMATQLLAPGAIARFKAERQILANLKHPYVAALLDGGATDDGLPYLVMEYIDGAPIDAYCRDQKLNLDDRLTLFRKVCEAVDYAHRQLIVHRDLKPGNILIDRDGNPKLLDFGIAKLIDSRNFEQTVAETRPGVLVMTPEYASPEQVRGEPVSVASDVYALGVLLFKLLTGQSPYAGDMTTPGSFERAVVETDPRKPSTAVSESSGSAAEPASTGPSDEKLRALLAGDLDIIILRALQKAPERRYRTVADLSEDIGRHQSHVPIEARADDWWYRSGKFVRRHAARLAVAALILTAGVAVVTFYTLRLAEERDRSNLSAAEAEQVAEFLTGLFEGASPNQQAGNEVSVVDLLEAGRERIDELQDQPELQARLMRIMSNSTVNLGRFDVAIPMLERTLELQESLEPYDGVAVSLVTHSLAAAHRQHGNLQEAEAYERQTIDLAIEAFGEDHDNVAYLRMRLGVILLDLGRIEESLAIKREALAQMEALGNGDTTRALDARGNIAVALGKLGRHQESTELAGEVARQSITIQGERHPNTIIRWSNYANGLRRLGRLQDALDILANNIPLGIEVWGEDYYHVMFMHQVRGATHRLAGNFEASLHDYRTAQAIAQRISGEGNYRRGDAWRGLGSALVAAGELDEGRLALEQALAIAQKAEGGDARVPYLHYQLGHAAFLEGDLLESQRQYDLALLGVDAINEMDRRAFNTGRLRVLTATGDLEAGARLIEPMLALDDAMYHLPALEAVAEFYRVRGDRAEALAIGERIQSIVDQSAQPVVWGTALALGEYGLALAACGRPQATEVLDAAVAVLTSVIGADDRRVRRLQNIEISQPQC